VAALGTILMDARKRRNPDFARFAAVSSNVPFAAVAQGRNRIVWREIGWIRPAAGLALFFVVLLVHPSFFCTRASNFATLTTTRSCVP
jgi:uncharacterized membrane protein